MEENSLLSILSHHTIPESVCWRKPIGRTNGSTYIDTQTQKQRGSAKQERRKKRKKGVIKQLQKRNEVGEEKSCEP
ncbi:hypothetical protein F2P79_002792 [Pimephales promelas]|nr:hypothetical protein F2P79_002792 [Pimephales promelas]